MSIFATPKNISEDSGLTTMFLHGLEGSTTGSKARYLAKHWSAKTPSLRTQELVFLKAEHNDQWSRIDPESLASAFNIPYSDALAAVNYSNPEIIVGSSLGGAILFKLMAEDAYTGPAVFCAPAILNLLPSEYVENAIKNKKENFQNTVWLLGETDIIVSNKENMRLAKMVGGSIIISPNDCHRLNKSVESNILNSAVTTAIELSARE